MDRENGMEKNEIKNKKRRKTGRGKKAILFLLLLALAACPVSGRAEETGETEEKTVCPEETEGTEETTVCPDGEHDYRIEKSTVSCTSSGVWYYKCTKCGAEKSEEAEATGHKWVAMEYACSLSCIGESYTKYMCRICREEKTEYYSGGFEHWNLLLLADYENVKLYECQDCGLLFDSSGNVYPADTDKAALLAQLQAENAEKTQEVTEEITKTVGGLNYTIYPQTGECTVSGVRYPSAAKTVKIPTSISCENVSYKVTKIASGAFRGCSNLRKVTIGSGVREIGARAFFHCKNLRRVTVQSKNVEKVGKKAFSGTKAKIRFKFPKGKEKKYRKLFKKY